MIWHNDTKKKAVLVSYEGEAGRWEFDPVDIAPGQFMVCLHCKRDSAATGSIGSVRVELGGEDWGKVNWSTPYCGSNYAWSDNDKHINVVGD